MVSHAPTHRIELDAGSDHIARWQFGIQRQRQVFGLQQLQLQGHDQSIFGTARAQANKTLATLAHRPSRQRLQAVKIRLAGGVRFLCPVAPERLHCHAEGFVLCCRLRLDAGTDGIGDEGFDTSIRPRVAAHQIPRFHAQFVGGRQHRSHRAGIAGHPRHCAPPTACSLMDGGPAEQGANFRDPAHQKPFLVVTRI